MVAFVQTIGLSLPVLIDFSSQLSTHVQMLQHIILKNGVNMTILNLHTLYTKDTRCSLK